MNTRGQRVTRTFHRAYDADAYAYGMVELSLSE
jgi:hypothetical protein